jgi:hypothetical protein
MGRKKRMEPGYAAGLSHPSRQKMKLLLGTLPVWPEKNTKIAKK